MATLQRQTDEKARRLAQWTSVWLKAFGSEAYEELSARLHRRDCFYCDYVRYDLVCGSRTYRNMLNVAATPCFKRDLELSNSPKAWCTLPPSACLTSREGQQPSLRGARRKRSREDDANSLRLRHASAVAQGHRSTSAETYLQARAAALFERERE